MEIRRAKSQDEFDVCIGYASCDVVGNIFLLADLYPPYREHSSVYYALDGENIVGLAIGFPLFPIYDINVRADSLEVERALLKRASRDIPPPLLTLGDNSQLSRLRKMPDVMTISKVTKTVHMILEKFTPLPTKHVPKRAGLDDLERLKQFYKENPVEVFLPEQVTAGPCYFLEENGDILSVAGVHFEAPQIGNLGNFITVPKYRKKGLGTACLQAVIEELLKRDKVVSLFVYPENTGAIRLYEQMGFKWVRDVHLVEWAPVSDTC